MLACAVTVKRIVLRSWGEVLRVIERYTDLADWC